MNTTAKLLTVALSLSRPTVGITRARNEAERVGFMPVLARAAELQTQSG